MFAKLPNIRTPLGVAAGAGRLEIARRLLGAGACRDKVCTWAQQHENPAFGVECCLKRRLLDGSGCDTHNIPSRSGASCQN